VDQPVTGTLNKKVSATGDESTVGWECAGGRNTQGGLTMLGDLSAKYESNGDPGAVSNGDGDASGVSYGVYQFATNSGVPMEFTMWLSKEGYAYANQLAGAAPGTTAFGQRWRAVAATDPDGFLAAQQKYATLVYYEPAKNKLEANYYFPDNHQEAVRQVIFSAAVQYSSYYLPELFFTACNKLGYQNLFEVDAVDFDAAMILAIYDVRATDEWINGSTEWCAALRNRLLDECIDASALLKNQD